MKVRMLILTLSVMTACSSNPAGTSPKSADAAQADDPSKGIICTYDRPTGSFLKEKHCTTPEQREATRRQQQTLMDVRNERDSAP